MRSCAREARRIEPTHANGELLADCWLTRSAGGLLPLRSDADADQLHREAALLPGREVSGHSQGTWRRPSTGAWSGATSAGPSVRHERVALVSVRHVRSAGRGGYRDQGELDYCFRISRRQGRASCYVG